AGGRVRRGRARRAARAARELLERQEGAGERREGAGELLEPSQVGTRGALPPSEPARGARLARRMARPRKDGAGRAGAPLLLVGARSRGALPVSEGTERPQPLHTKAPSPRARMRARASQRRSALQAGSPTRAGLP